MLNQVISVEGIEDSEVRKIILKVIDSLGRESTTRQIAKKARLEIDEALVYLEDMEEHVKYLRGKGAEAEWGLIAKRQVI